MGIKNALEGHHEAVVAINDRYQESLVGEVVVVPEVAAMVAMNVYCGAVDRMTGVVEAVEDRMLDGVELARNGVAMAMLSSKNAPHPESAPLKFLVLGSALNGLQTILDKTGRNGDK